MKNLKNLLSKNRSSATAKNTLSEKDWRRLTEQPFGTPRLSHQQPELANFNQRLGALFLDAWLIIFLTLWLWLFFGGQWWFALALGLLLPLLSWPIFSATPGQWLIGIMVLQEKTLAKISFQQAVLRLIAGLFTLGSAGMLRLWHDAQDRDIEARLSHSLVVVDSLRLLAKRRESP